MMYIKKDKGIALITLVITVIVISILAGVAIMYGTELFQTTTVETYITNMVTIRAKAKVFAEEVNAKTWDVSEENLSETRRNLYNDNYKMLVSSNSDEIIEKVDNTINGENGCECYDISKQTLELMGLDELTKETEDGDYVVVYNTDDYTKLDIIYQQGIEYKGVTYYTLSSLQNVI